jgi:hypothetical protein
MCGIRSFCLGELILFIATTVVSASVLVTLAGESVAETAPPDLPLGIICWNEESQSWGIAYLVTVMKDGTATYMPPGGQTAATINAKRTVEPPKDRPAVFDCFGKSVDELRALGRTIEIQHTR